MMHRARHYSGVPTLARLVIVSLVTLEIMAVGPGLRHASASTGCDIINNQPSQFAFHLQLISAFDAGDATPKQRRSVDALRARRLLGPALGPQMELELTICFNIN